MDDDSEENEPTSKVSLFLEYLPYKLKSSYISKTLKIKIAIEIAFSMQYIHRLGMIHHDHEIDNIMANYIFKAKIIDFNLAFVIDKEEFDKSLANGIGTFDYMSPEMLNKEEHNNKTDVYSYGIVLYFLFTGEIPKQSLTDKMNKKPIVFPRPSSAISSKYIKIINKCTKFELKKTS